MVGKRLVQQLLAKRIDATKYVSRVNSILPKSLGSLLGSLFSVASPKDSVFIWTR